ncbi:SDR family NAD(P)-dependent oxidoreductase [Pseudemcibacter aquimaris]|uniref:SDR family NAD(P)-dependent oxidoreductase n=1 Tax=Pseudemcibacter aquimaris TaxID=2857064 RepID=UPI0020139D72|nr:SDR family NAD(P)-dependent oxidoreductase [Pseudemcibacter aquimaris]MCC3859799.1 SDR family NAD(P)-dependent oxidoreductase [Pseudemcibacter aquimaris]WDU60193.1 SDR family NAD(P)-dependent oxidoreductase [Pseudemcibacter aquimaris]
MKKVIVVTGATGALGLDTVKKLARKNFTVVGICRGKMPDFEHDNVSYIENCDLSIKEQADNAIAEVANQHGHIFGLINIAGGFIWKTIADTTMEDIENQFSMNFKTMFNATKAALDYMYDGRIINIGATGAINADQGMAAYAISKSAVLRFTEALSKETPETITVNAILPSIIDTPQNRKDMPDADTSEWVKTSTLVREMVYYLSDEGAVSNGEMSLGTADQLKGRVNV